MSYNSNFFYKYRGKATFQIPKVYAAPSQNSPPIEPWASEATNIDNQIITQFEAKIPNIQPAVKSAKSISISTVHDQLRNLASELNEIKLKQKLLSEKINDLSDDEWSIHLKQVEESKAKISRTLSNVNNFNTDVLRKLLAKRASKRVRQKRQRVERRKYKEELKNKNEEKSRKIDEYLQKFQDDIKRAEQEEEAKFQADVVLKETIRKKQDAKKYIVKLDALVKLRKARMNTAQGRGENVSLKEAEVFETNIEKLKAMWSQRLVIYEKEESELKAKLQQDSLELTNRNVTEEEVCENLSQWKDVLFGGTLPQVDFAGKVDKFLAVRSQWDQYLNVEGTSIPIGWVPPTAKTNPSS